MAPSLVSAVRRVVLIGGVRKAELLLRLQAAGVQLNELAHALFADKRFTTVAASSRIETVELKVTDLGLPDGGTFATIAQQASNVGLVACPLELGPYLRLQLLDQPEGSTGKPASPNRAPPGSITVASEPIAADDDTPCGFYLRRIDGALWLRGYRSWPGHLWSPEDTLIFSIRDNAAQE
jgi:hypothetical protein